MQIFKLKLNAESGAIEGFSSETVNTSTAIETYEALKNANDEFVGEGVNNLAVALNSLGFKFSKPSIARNGQILKIKIGKTTVSDVTAWSFDLESPGILDLIEGLKNADGKLPKKPTALVINGFKDAMYKNAGDVQKAKASRMSFMEALMSSKKIPARKFRPAYAGGLISSPANKRKVYENVTSFDISSSYPYSAISQLLPTGPSTEAKREGQRVRMTVNADGTLAMGSLRKRAGAVPTGFIGIFIFKGVQRREWVKVPMIRETDHHWVEDGVFDKNGLVSGDLQAAFCQPDLKAFAIQYTWDSVEIQALECHELAPLPKSARQYIMDCFKIKKEATDPVERLKAKTAINTIVGLWGIDPFREAEVDVLGEHGSIIQRHQPNLGKAWLKYAGEVGGNGYTSGGHRVWDFRWAVYTVAYARLRIVEAEKALAEAGAEVLYCDTDSLKFVGPGREVFEKLNEDVLKKNAAIGIPAEMGVWVDESKDFSRAVFRGRKFYVNEAPDGQLHPHIAGIYRHHSEAIFKRISLDDLAFLPIVEIRTSRPSVGVLPDDPFGAAHQQMAKPVIFEY